MAIDGITSLIAPPPVPKQVGTVADWQVVERELGIVLPSDYRDFILSYGTGQLANLYSVWNPFRGSEFIEQVRLVCRCEQEFQKQFPHRCPYAIHPQRPGFLPWGTDENGNYYGWLTEGPSDKWPVLSNNVRGHGYKLYRLTMTEYFAAVLRGEILPLASDYPCSDDLVFTPW